MIKGVKEWSKREHYYTQTNNPTEAYLKATLNQRGNWLESCGPTSAVNCLAAMGKNVEITCPGTYKPQPEEVLMDYFNDPRNKAILDSIRRVDDDIPKNRVPQFYVQAAYAVFGESAAFRWGLLFHEVANQVVAGRAVQLCLKDPSHYVAVIAYNLDKRELIYNDSWGERFKDGKGGWHRTLSEQEFKSNVQTFFIVYGL